MMTQSTRIMMSTRYQQGIPTTMISDMFREIHYILLVALMAVCTGAQWTCQIISDTDKCNCSLINKGVSLNCENERIQISEGILGTKINITCTDNLSSLALPSINVGHVNELAVQDCLASGTNVQEVLDQLGIDKVKYLVIGGKYDGLRTQLVNLSNVDSVCLKGLGLFDIASDVFGDSNVRDLDLRVNNITELHKGVFSGLHHLRGLFLSNNRLTTLPDQLFLHNVELVAIHLDNNQLHHLSSKLLEPLRNLQLLILSNNKLKHITGGEWNLPALRGLYLANNELTSLAEGTSQQSVLRACLNLTHINVANNSLSQIYQDWTRLTRLRELRLSHNHLRSIQIENLDFLLTNINVHLDYNKITEVKFNQSSLLEKYSPRAAIIVYMHGNPFRCDCDIHPFVRLPKGSSSSVFFDIPRPDRRVVFKGTDKMVCASPQSMKSHPVMAIPLDDFACSSGGRTEI